MGYHKREGRFPSADGVTEVYYAVFVPEGNPRAVLQISHGMYEYIDRYENEGIITVLTDAGLVVCGNDHLGHGLTAKDEETLGHIGDYHHVVDDLHTLNGILRKTYPRLPYLMLGHSMGSLLARAYMVGYQDIDAVILSGTPDGNQPVGVGMALAKLIALARGSQHHSPMLKKLTHAHYNKAFAGEKDLYSWISSLPAVRERYAADRYCTSTLTCSGYREVYRLLSDVSDDDWSEQVPLSLPILILSGEEDPVGANGESAQELYRTLEDREVNELRLKLYPKARHEILNESCRQAVLDDLLAFVDEVIAGVIACRSYESIPFGRTDFSS